MSKGRGKLQISEHLENGKKLFRRNKKHLLVFGGLSFGEKINLIKNSEHKLLESNAKKHYLL